MQKARKETLDPKQRQYYELLKMSCLYLTNSLDFENQREQENRLQLNM